MRTIVICISVITFTLLQGCQPYVNAQVTDVQETPILRVGTIYGAATYLVIQDKDHASGFDYDLAQKFANFIGAELDMVVFDNISQMFNALKNKEIDLIAASITHNQTRAQDFIFTPPLYQVKQQLVYKMRQTKRPRSLKELEGEVMIVAESSHAQTLKQKEKQKQYPNLKWKETQDHSSEELLSMIVEGKIKYTIADSTTLAINRRYTPDLGIGFSLTKKEHISWVLSKKDSDKLLSQLLDFWKKEKKAGTFDLLNEKYFGHVKKFDFVDTKAFIRAVKRKLPRYKSFFQKYSGKLDWRKIAATSYQESHWNPKAISPTGVRGMMMLTRPTAKQMKIRNRLDPEQSIKGGAKYLNYLMKRVPKDVPEDERMWFALASYNIGFGHMMDARKLSKMRGLNPNSWKDLKKVFPLLHERKHYRKTKYGYARGKEAVHYVDNIRRYYDTLVWIDTQHSYDLTTDEMIHKYEKEHPIQNESSLTKLITQFISGPSDTEEVSNH
tara:strand:- start:6614 stop:8107 length:1494 start_codon:yes stop_codon:yes gene_type:complete